MKNKQSKKSSILSPCKEYFSKILKIFPKSAKYLVKCWNNIPTFYKIFVKKVFKPIKSFFVNYKELFKYFGQFLFTIGFYGAVLAFIFSVLYDHDFNFMRVIALGLISYIVKVELPPIISSSFPKPPRGGMMIQS